MTTCCEEKTPSGVKRRTPRGGEFTFDELSARAKDRARDWWRESAMQDDWWEQVYEDAAEIGLQLLLTQPAFNIHDSTPSRRDGCNVLAILGGRAFFHMV